MDHKTDNFAQGCKTLVRVQSFAALDKIVCLLIKRFWCILILGDFGPESLASRVGGLQTKLRKNPQEDKNKNDATAQYCVTAHARTETKLYDFL